jgi:hypothetical protein
LTRCQLCGLELRGRERFEHAVIQHPRGAIEKMSIAWTFTVGLILVSLGLGGILGMLLQFEYGGARTSLLSNVLFIILALSGITTLVLWTIRLNEIYSRFRIKTPLYSESKDSLEDTLRRVE